LAVYRKLVSGMAHKEITFRTLDIGGDKVLSYFDHHSKEDNPSLGLRSIRFSLRYRDIFSQQIKAILRAGIDSEIRIMFPMISSLDEFIEAKNVVLKCIEQLNQRQTRCHQSPQLGLMIELPAVLEIIDEFAQEADFFSIGTNDFIQYMLAVDRGNEKVADLYLPEHPAILRALKRIVVAAQKYGKDVSICGDMAHDVKYLSYFLGIGIKKLSLNPGFLPEIQKAIGAINVGESKEFTARLLKKSKLSEINALL